MLKMKKSTKIRKAHSSNSKCRIKYKQYISFALYADDMLQNLPLIIIHLFLLDLPAFAFFLVNEKYKRVI